MPFPTVRPLYADGRAVAAWNERLLDDFYAMYHPDVVHHGTDGLDRHGVAEPETRIIASLQIEAGTTATDDPFSFEGMLFIRLGDDDLVHEAWEQIRL